MDSICFSYICVTTSLGWLSVAFLSALMKFKRVLAFVLTLFLLLKRNPPLVADCTTTAQWYSALTATWPYRVCKEFLVHKVDVTLQLCSVSLVSTEKQAGLVETATECLRSEGHARLEWHGRTSKVQCMPCIKPNRIINLPTSCDYSPANLSLISSKNHL